MILNEYINTRFTFIIFIWISIQILRFVQQFCNIPYISIQQKREHWNSKVILLQTHRRRWLSRIRSWEATKKFRDYHKKFCDVGTVLDMLERERERKEKTGTFYVFLDVTMAELLCTPELDTQAELSSELPHRAFC